MPRYLLFEVGVLLATLAERRAVAGARRIEATLAGGVSVLAGAPHVTVPFT